MSSPYVLIIEDDLDIQRLLSLHVLRTGAEVQAVSTGEEGLAAAAASTPALVLLDLHLPGVDGWGVVEALAAAEATARTPVLVVSVEDMVRTAFPSLRGWLVKPFQGRDVDESVRRILSEPRGLGVA